MSDNEETPKVKLVLEINRVTFRDDIPYDVLRATLSFVVKCENMLPTLDATKDGLVYHQKQLKLNFAETKTPFSVTFYPDDDIKDPSVMYVFESGSRKFLSYAEGEEWLQELIGEIFLWIGVSV